MPNHLVVALAYDRLCTFEFGIAVEVFGLPRPEMGQDWYRFAVCAVDPGPLQATGGFHVVADGGLELLPEAGTIIVPGWRGALSEPVPPALIEGLRRAHERGARIMSICSGVFVLAAAGLLSGRRTTTHWHHVDQLAEAYPDIRVAPDVLYVDEGSVLTSAGSAAGIDLCLHVVRHDYGSEIANRLARRLVVPPHREGGQAQFVERPVPPIREGARLGPLFDRMRSRLAEDQPVAELAAEAGMSVRTFLRRFKSATGMPPGEWLLAERLLRARELLETTTHSIEDIAAASGFGSPATLRHHFRSRLGTSPAAYRIHFTRELTAP
ncbi:transcriptional regulator FtrA [Microvirga aerophila]|uniref:Transcriptional regulator FtrA n=1 Tax=Microvirga aerophila TaxID=670291 RepID=A0A512BUH4_9HYPH|nr:transcriptional regulator FtrA [Microvirga aerophila]GEO15621.1 transcriptional regulator FtrA [Microvirga aerophila]